MLVPGMKDLGAASAQRTPQSALSATFTYAYLRSLPTSQNGSIPIRGQQVPRALTGIIAREPTQAQLHIHVTECTNRTQCVAYTAGQSVHQLAALVCKQRKATKKSLMGTAASES